MIRYETWEGGPGTPNQRFHRAAMARAEREATRLCDVGAGANPLLNRAEATAAGVAEYVLTDISAEELEKAPDDYEKVVADVTLGQPPGLGGFDLIVSHTVAEHVADPHRFHRAVFEMLTPGGCAMHFFPTFYEPAFLLNRALPERLGSALLGRIQAGREPGGDHQKFPALYRWCRGPTRRQLRRFESAGFEVEEYVGVFGHGYFDGIYPLNRIERKLAEVLRRRPLPALTSYAWVRLRRPRA